MWLQAWFYNPSQGTLLILETSTAFFWWHSLTWFAIKNKNLTRVTLTSAKTLKLRIFLACWKWFPKPFSFDLGNYPLIYKNSFIHTIRLLSFRLNFWTQIIFISSQSQTYAVGRRGWDFKRIPKEFSKKNQRVPKEFSKNSQWIPKEFHKNSQRIPNEFQNILKISNSLHRT